VCSCLLGVGVCRLGVRHWVTINERCFLAKWKYSMQCQYWYLLNACGAVENKLFEFGSDVPVCFDGIHVFGLSV
jgi:hypothetical protein